MKEEIKITEYKDSALVQLAVLISCTIPSGFFSEETGRLISDALEEFHRLPVEVQRQLHKTHKDKTGQTVLDQKWIKEKW